MRARTLGLAGGSILLVAIAFMLVFSPTLADDPGCYLPARHQPYRIFLPLICGQGGAGVTPTATAAATPTPSPSATLTATVTPSATATRTGTPTDTNTPTTTNSATPSATATATRTATRTPTPTASLTVIPSPTPTLSPPVTPRVGHWTGVTSRGHAMSFDVISSGGQWRTFNLTTDWTATACGVTTSGTVSVSITGPGTIADGQFNTSGLFSFSGRFDTPTTATGSYGFANYPISYTIPVPPYICNIHLFQTGIWTATAQ